jgi:hypothetical protein
MRESPSSNEAPSRPPSSERAVRLERTALAKRYLGLLGRYIAGEHGSVRAITFERLRAQRKLMPPGPSIREAAKATPDAAAFLAIARQTADFADATADLMREALHLTPSEWQQVFEEYLEERRERRP